MRYTMPKAQPYAKEFLHMIETWHAEPEVWDSELDAEIHAQYAEILKRDQPKHDAAIPYFSPSSSDACPRQLYAKITGAKKDKQSRQPHQGRWTRIGTAWGDVVQRDLLFIEKHYEKRIGEAPAFVPERTDEGFPAWEDFIKAHVIVNHRGHEFALRGTSDGILVHRDGTRIGLEVKSKQTTAARTSLYSMREPELKHVKQCVTYAIMYGLDRYLIVYGNLSKKSWVYDDETYEKTPDFRVFEIAITDAMKASVLDYFANVMDAVEKGTPPPVDLGKWTFNDYKTEIAKTITDDEYDALKTEVRKVMRSSRPEFIKAQYYGAYEFIREIRQEVSADG